MQGEREGNPKKCPFPDSGPVSLNALSNQHTQHHMAYEALIEATKRTRLGPGCTQVLCTAQRKHGKGPCHQPSTKLSRERGRPLCQYHGGAKGRDRSKLSTFVKARQASFKLKGLILKAEEPVQNV